MSDDVTRGRAARATDAAAAGFQTGAGPDAPALAFDGVTFTYAGAASPVLRDVRWRVPQGAFALVVGGTGSGKSTLLSLAKPEIAPAGERCGAIRVLGAPVEELDAQASARSVGYVFQHPENQIVCESVWHELAFGLENLGTPAAEMRRLVAETSYFFGIDDWFRSDTATLSGGRKQVLALAATLVMQPRVLLLDEPTAQLDPIAEKTFLHALFRVNRELGCTVVVATHRPRPMVDYATCAFCLADGRIEALADLDALRVREPLLVGDARPAEPAASADGASADGAQAPAPSARARAGRRDADRAAVAVERAWFRYGRDEGWVLRGLDLAVARGGIHTLVGGNGCGKSTLLALMAGVRKPQRGRVRRGAASSALLPQDPRALFVAETVEDELMEWSGRARYDRAAVDELLGRLGLAGVARQHPYDLSGGQQQLVALAKLILIDPELLLLDEPTKGLDLAARRAVAALLRELARAGRTVVMATHDLDAVEQLADDVSMIFDGEVACTAPCGEFFEGNVYYRP